MQRTIHPRLQGHPAYDKDQLWILSRKSGRTSRCSGCLKKDCIKPKDLHLFVDGLLYLKDHDRVVETKLRFCPKRICVSVIKSNLNNIKSLCSMEVRKSEDTDITDAERTKILDEGFVIL